MALGDMSLRSQMNQLRNCIDAIPVPGLGLVGQIADVPACIASELCKHKVDGAGAYADAAAYCTASHATGSLGHEIGRWVGLPFAVMSCAGDVAGAAGLYTPTYSDVVTHSGHRFKWDTTGTVWGFFHNLSTGFHIVGDEVWEEAMKPSLLFLGKVCPDHHNRGRGGGISDFRIKSESRNFPHEIVAQLGPDLR